MSVVTEINGKVVTPKLVFEELMNRAIGADPSLRKGIEAAIQFDLDGPEGGKWYIDFRKDSDWVGAGELPDAKMTIFSTDEVFVSIVSGKINAQSAFMSGKIKAQPMDMQLGMKLVQIMSKGREEFAKGE